MNYNIFISGDGINSCNIDLTEQEYAGVQKVFAALAKNAGDDRYSPTGSIVPVQVAPVVNTTPPAKKKRIVNHKTAMQIAMEKAGIAV